MTSPAAKLTLFLQRTAATPEFATISAIPLFHLNQAKASLAAHVT
jgi:hypothetical protein